MGTLSFEVNNNRTMKLVQRQNGDVQVMIERDNWELETLEINEAFISPSDFVMLINYYRYIKRNDYRHDFINPNGKNKEAE